MDDNPKSPGAIVRLVWDLADAAEPSRELSDRVLLASDWVCDGDRWISPAGADGKAGDPIAAADRPHPTASLDAARDLIPGHWTWSIGSDGKAAFGYVQMNADHRAVEVPGHVVSCVLCAAYVAAATQIVVSGPGH